MRLVCGDFIIAKSGWGEATLSNPFFAVFARERSE